MILGERGILEHLSKLDNGSLVPLAKRRGDWLVKNGRERCLLGMKEMGVCMA